MTKSAGFDKAVARARKATHAGGGASETVGPTEEMTLAEVVSLSDAVQEFDPAYVMEALKAGGYVASERFMTLAPGQMMTGFLLGRSTAVVPDPKTGDPRQVARWHFELDSGARVSHLGAAQLDRQLADIPLDGSHHCIVTVGTEKAKTNRGLQMGQWYVFSSRKRDPVKQLAAPVEPAPAPAPAPVAPSAVGGGAA